MVNGEPMMKQKISEQKESGTHYLPPEVIAHIAEMKSRGIKPIPYDRFIERMVEDFRKEHPELFEKHPEEIPPHF
jgi:hypothetical protein